MNIIKNNTAKSITFIIFGLIVISSIFFKIYSIPSSKRKIVINMPSVENIYNGTDVLYAGKQIGEVLSISSKNDNEQNQKYHYEIIAAINSDVNISSYDEIFSSMSNMLGDRVINIQPSPKKDPIKDNHIFYAKIDDPIKNSISGINDLFSSVEESLETLNSFVKNGSDDALSTMHNINNISDNVNELLKNPESKNLINTIILIGNKLSSILKSIESSTNSNNTNIISSIYEIVENIKLFTDSIANNDESVDLLTILNKTIKNIERLTAENSSLSKLLDNDELYIKLNNILDKVDNILYDVNVYGIFFNSNRNWKKDRLPKYMDTY